MLSVEAHCLYYDFSQLQNCSSPDIFVLTALTPKNKNIFVKFRTANHHLPVETGRWHGKSISERLCTLCNSGETGDKFHLILECKSL